MKKNFWQKLKCPFFVLAPMADVTDFVFREIITCYGKPDVFFTEFVSIDGLCSIGRKNLLSDLKFSPEQQPVVAQIFGRDPKKFYQVAKFLKKMGFSGIDINMGCPEKKIIKQGAGSFLILEPKLACEIILATKEGAEDLPVSVKTRIGYNENILEDWIPRLLAVEPAVITVHGRTKKEMSKAPADWGAIKRAVALRDKLSPQTLIIGNGDVSDLTEGIIRARESGVDGVMIGRGIFGKPWLFNKKNYQKGKLIDQPIEEKLKIMLEHTKLFKQVFRKNKNFSVMKKHFKAYVSDFSGAKDLRMKLMGTKNYLEVKKIIRNYLSTLLSS